MKFVLFAVIASSLFGAFLLWLSFQFRYRITEQALEVTLFGFCVRRVLLDDIKHITTHIVSGKYEHWANTLLPSRQTLVIIRRSGLRPHFLITPRFRYEFRKSLQRALGQEETEDTAIFERVAQ